MGGSVAACNVASAPARLEVVAARDAIDIEELPCEEEAGHVARAHGGAVDGGPAHCGK